MDQWGRYRPETGPDWIMALSGKPCKIITTNDDRATIRIFNTAWGIQGGLIMNCPKEHVEVVGTIE